LIKNSFLKICLFKDNLNEKYLPSRNIKITVATLERELENWKLKYKKLQVKFLKLLEDPAFSTGGADFFLG
jgi:hypothetical protein